MFLAEKLFIITIDEQSGKINRPFFLEYTIVGAILLDLLFLKKITLEKKRFSIIIRRKGTKLTGIKIMDYFLEELSSRPKGMTVYGFIRKFAMYETVKTMQIFLKTLFEREFVLEVSEKPPFSYYKVKEFSLAQPEIKQEIINEIKKVFNTEKKPAKESLAMLSMLYSSWSIKNIFKGDDRIQAQKTMKRYLAKRKSLLKNYSEDIYYVTKTIRNVIIKAGI